MSVHTCHAAGCTTRVPRRMFMCLKHWRMLPDELQRLVWGAYKPGQENDPSLVTERYLKVTRKAIRFIAKQESKL